MWRGHLLPLGRFLIVVSDEAYHHCYISKLHQLVGAMFGRAVTGIEGVQQGAEEPALIDSVAEGECGRGVISYPDHLGASG